MSDPTVTARRDPRGQLKPWLRRWPIALIRALLIAMVPVAVVYGAAAGMIGGVREVVSELWSEWKGLRS